MNEKATRTSAGSTRRGACERSDRPRMQTHAHCSKHSGTVQTGLCACTQIIQSIDRHTYTSMDREPLEQWGAASCAVLIVDIAKALDTDRSRWAHAHPLYSQLRCEGPNANDKCVYVCRSGPVAPWKPPLRPGMQPANTADGRSTPPAPREGYAESHVIRTHAHTGSIPSGGRPRVAFRRARRLRRGGAGLFFSPVCGCSIRSLERKEMRTSSRARAVFAGWGNLSLGARTARPRARARVGPTAHRNATSKVYPSPSPTTRSRGGTRHHTCARRGRRAFGDEPYYATDA